MYFKRPWGNRKASFVTNMPWITKTAYVQKQPEWFMPKQKLKVEECRLLLNSWAEGTGALNNCRLVRSTMYLRTPDSAHRQTKLQMTQTLNSTAGTGATRSTQCPKGSTTECEGELAEQPNRLDEGIRERHTYMTSDLTPRVLGLPYLSLLQTQGWLL